MPTLPDELFSLLENKTLQAREAAEKAARNILVYLRVDGNTWWGEKDDSKRDLWLGLRARARQFGYASEESSEKDPVKRGLAQLVNEIAYEQWHRMLFARFLAENHLLMHPSGVAVSLNDCEELAPEEGEEDAWRLAERYASVMLPGIFKQDDPCTQVRLTPSDHHTLEGILLDIPALVFTCDDSLGWMYQFWQTKQKKELNNKERKIGGADLSPVTQLFTEDYMVRFLLENSLGAWWATRHPDSPLIREWDYLRFNENGTPATSTFPGWPEHAADVTIMDPCCGSGHFLVAAFDMLRKMRMEEEYLDSAVAGDFVLRDNLYGLELDVRCTQIAAFGLSLIAWKNGGYRQFNEINIACTGITITSDRTDWLNLSNGDSNIEWTLERLFSLFSKADDLGSLINPINIPLNERLFAPNIEQLYLTIEQAIQLQNNKANSHNIFGFQIKNILGAALFLSRNYTLVVTNVPYLGRGKQNELLQKFGDTYFPNSKADLATMFLERCLAMTKDGGTCATVTPQAWLFASSYFQFRGRLLRSQRFLMLSILGEGGFMSSQAAGAFTILSIISRDVPEIDDKFAGFDLSKVLGAKNKSEKIKTNKFEFFQQSKQLLIPECRIVLSFEAQNELLSIYARSLQGIKTGDDNRMRRYYWEFDKIPNRWKFYQSTVEKTQSYGGLEFIVNWTNRGKDLARLQGNSGWNKKGIAVSLMRQLRCSLYMGDLFDSNMAAIIPKDPKNLPAIWAFCQSSEFDRLVRMIDRRVNAMTGSLVKIPFDLDYWQNVANKSEKIPEPFSNDPTQWIFFGIINNSLDPLQVAIARLSGYNWPQQKPDGLHNFLDEDGIVCLPVVNGEASAAERLRALLAAAYGIEWSGSKQEELLAAAGYSGKDLADWLCDGFFEQHCRLFHNRPFMWHIWDGRKDGFSALVNYHKLDRSNLEKLTYSYLGTWITDRKKDLEKGVAGAEGRLLAAQTLQDKLKLILAGEPPYDIYVRWKPLHEQPIGWDPDLNDGVRFNIRPFVNAGVLRSKFTINWNKDRGKNPDDSERMNDLHYTNEQKRKQSKR